MPNTENGYLRLTRFQGQKIFVGDNIVIAIGKTTKEMGTEISISAPKDIAIVREELISTPSADA